MKKPSEIELAYCAGVIDSDGCIGLYARPRSTGGYTMRVTAAQVEPAAIELLHSVFGGARFMMRPNHEKWRSLHKWEAGSLVAEACLRTILPYLRIKGKQAEKCLEYSLLKHDLVRRMSPRGWRHARSPFAEKEMRRICDEVRQLNSVGRKS